MLCVYPSFAAILATIPQGTHQRSTNRGNSLNHLNAITPRPPSSRPLTRGYRGTRRHLRTKKKNEPKHNQKMKVMTHTDRIARALVRGAARTLAACCCSAKRQEGLSKAQPRGHKNPNFKIMTLALSVQRTLNTNPLRKIAVNNNTKARSSDPSSKGLRGKGIFDRQGPGGTKSDNTTSRR